MLLKRIPGIQAPQETEALSCTTRGNLSSQVTKGQEKGREVLFAAEPLVVSYGWWAPLLGEGHSMCGLFRGLLALGSYPPLPQA